MEPDLVVVQNDGDLALLVGRSCASGLAERPLGNDRLGLAVRRRGELPNRQAVGIRGCQDDPLAADLDENTREHRTRFVLGRRPTGLPDRQGECAGVGLDLGPRRLLDGGEILHGQQPQGALVGRALDLRLAGIGGEVDRSLRQRLHDIRQQPDRDEG